MQSAFYSTRGALALSGSIDAIDLFPSPMDGPETREFITLTKNIYHLPIQKCTFHVAQN
jgi:hypothetical protein